MKHNIDINDGDLEYTMARVDRFISVLESFKKGSVKILGYNVLSWEVK